MVTEPSPAELAAAIAGVPFDTAPMEQSARKREREIQYWKLHATCSPMCMRHRDRKGWVTTGPTLSAFSAIEYTNFMESKHAVPLSKAYGTDSGLIIGKPDSGTMYGGGTRFHLLIKNGGISEFPDEQLIAYGWHRIPLVQRTREGMAERVVLDIKCEYGCPDRLFTQESHYTTHVAAMHQDSAGARAVGKQFQDVLKTQGNSPGVNTTELATAIALAILQFEQTKTINPTTPVNDLPVPALEDEGNTEPSTEELLGDFRLNIRDNGND